MKMEILLESTSNKLMVDAQDHNVKYKFKEQAQSKKSMITTTYSQEKVKGLALSMMGLPIVNAQLVGLIGGCALGLRPQERWYTLVDEVLALGWLEEIHVTWAYLEKKKTRL
ncbi:hypothetical protein Tco_1548370 [Tanacetum coccineum]